MLGDVLSDLTPTILPPPRPDLHNVRSSPARARARHQTPRATPKPPRTRPAPRTWPWPPSATPQRRWPRTRNPSWRSSPSRPPDAVAQRCARRRQRGSCGSTLHPEVGICQRADLASYWQVPHSSVSGPVVLTRHPGRVAEQMGDLEHALSAYENALRHNPMSLPGLTQVAGIARIKENYPKVCDNRTGSIPRWLREPILFPSR